MPRFLLVNPWITDVAAYDFWAKPLGLLYWAARLREWGAEVALVDCTERAHPSLAGDEGKPGRFNTGKYRTELWADRPEAARIAKRRFRRYGISPEAFERDLDDFEEAGGPPDAILVSSRMTYWNHGVADAIGRCRKEWPEVPVALGGIYATLCPEHARLNSGADLVFEGDALDALPKWLGEKFPGMAAKIETPLPDPDTWPRPAYDLCHGKAALPLLTSVGCPYRCTYCASQRLAPDYLRRSPALVFEEARDCRARFGTEDFAFYDDALLVDAGKFIEPFLNMAIGKNLGARFHTPNGMHYWKIDDGLAGKMKAAGFETIRLSLETIRDASLKEWKRGGDSETFKRVVKSLREAGFSRQQIGIYIMAGVPGQTVEDVRRTIEFVFETGAIPKLNEFSPIPGTPEWERALEAAGPEGAKELISEPVWQNNSLYAARGESFTLDEMQELKMLSRGADR
jgi:radical SAM superfamily enzyme YgiQ (UPF0313 family)